MVAVVWLRSLNREALCCWQSAGSRVPLRALVVAGAAARELKSVVRLIKLSPDHCGLKTSKRRARNGVSIPLDPAGSARFLFGPSAGGGENALRETRGARPAGDSGLGHNRVTKHADLFDLDL